jgi:hypothetical protein
MGVGVIPVKAFGSVSNTGSRVKIDNMDQMSHMSQKKPAILEPLHTGAAIPGYKSEMSQGSHKRSHSSMLNRSQVIRPDLMKSPIEPSLVFGSNLDLKQQLQDDEIIRLDHVTVPTELKIVMSADMEA